MNSKIEYQWIYGGKLKSGEQFFYDKSGDCAVEREFKYLDSPTWEEMQEIQIIMKEAKP